MTEELEQMSPNQRRALDKALSALEAFASIWAAEIRLSELSARIAAVPSEAERAKRIAAMIEQGFIEGAYRHYLDHKDKCDEIAAAQPSIANSASAIGIEVELVRDRVHGNLAIRKWTAIGDLSEGKHVFHAVRVANAQAVLTDEEIAVSIRKWFEIDACTDHQGQVFNYTRLCEFARSIAVVTHKDQK